VLIFPKTLRISPPDFSCGGGSAEAKGIHGNHVYIVDEKLRKYLIEKINQ